MMLLPPHHSWLRILFKYRGTALPRMYGRLVITTVLAIIVTVLHLRMKVYVPNLTPLPFTLIGLALGIFLGFRNNTSYDRFWEGRKLWGALVNTTRTITRQILTLIGPQPPVDGRDGRPAAEIDRAELRKLQQKLVYTVIAYVHSFRLHLRDQDIMDKLNPFLAVEQVESLRTEINRPYAILQMLGQEFREAWVRGWIHPQHLPVLEQSLAGLMDIQGGCERIKSTPIPLSYTSLIHQIVAIYCLALPFGIIHTVAHYTPIVVAFTTYAFYGLDAIGDELENPFGKDPNDLPLTALTRMIEVNLRQRLGEKELPPLFKPRRGGLLT